MVMDATSIFISRFNSAVLQRSKTFSIPSSKVSLELLSLLYKEGYIFSYKFTPATCSFLVFINHSSVDFKLKRFSLPSRKFFFTCFALKKQINRGRFLIIRTNYGFQFSDIARFYKVGGTPVFFLNKFLDLMALWITYIFRPSFVDYLELTSSYLVISGLSTSFFIPKFVQFKSQVAFFRKKLQNLRDKLKTFFQILHVKGIGFKVYYYRKTTSLYLNLGYNHICKYCLESVGSVKVRKQYLLLFTPLSSIMFFVNEIKNLRKPDPYRGKGIRFRFQEIKFKPGKQR